MFVNANEIAQAMGGTEALGRQVNTQAELEAVVRDGVPAAAFDALDQRLSIASPAPQSALSSIVKRRLIAGRLVLVRTESTRIERVARIYAIAEKILGSNEVACKFLLQSNPMINGDTPLSLLSSEEGARKVENMLAAIAFGFPV